MFFGLNALRLLRHLFAHRLALSTEALLCHPALNDFCFELVGSKTLVSVSDIVYIILMSQWPPDTQTIAQSRTEAVLSRQSLPDRIAEALRQRILEGLLPAGQQLRQEALAEEFGVSRIPLREALRRLEAEGLVTLVPNKGALVSSLAPGEVRELFEMRALLESELLRRAVPNIKQQHLIEAGKALAEYDDALSRQSVKEWGALNWRFHGALYAAAGRPRWMEEVRAINQQTDRFIRMQLALSGALDQARAEHADILRLAREGQTEAAAQAVANHIHAAGEMLARQLGETKGHP